MTVPVRVSVPTAVLLTILLLVPWTVPGMPGVSAAEPELLSQGKPVRASAVENNDPELVAKHAVDGSLATRWASHHEDPSWIWVDLGKASQVQRVEIVWEAAYSTSYGIGLSDDGVNWTNAAWVDAADGGTDVLQVSGTGRYVRLFGETRNGIAGHSLWEFRVFGSPVPDKKPEQEPESGKDQPAQQEQPEQPASPPPANTPPPQVPSAPSDRPTPDREGPPGSVVYYVVKQRGDRAETIEDIAQRLLGSSARWPEIVQLSKSIRQKDGKYLTDPHTLLAGWVLQLPDDAVGDGVKFGRLPGSETKPRPSPSPTPSPSPSPSPVAAQESVDGSDAATGVLLPLGLALGGALLLAGLVLAAVRLTATVRKRRAERIPFDDSVLRTDTSAAWTVDHALRALIAACERDGLDVPGVTGVFVEGSTLRLRLTNPASVGPAPWAVSEDGQSWVAPLSKLQAAPVSDGSTARFARLVNLGMSETGRVLVNFALARGVVSLDGSVRARHEVLRRWLGEFTGNPWSGEPRVVMVGDGLPRPDQVEHVSGFDQVKQEMEVGDGGVLVLSQPPSSADRDFLAERFADPAFGWVVIVLGSWPGAKWRFTARDDGWLRSGFLPQVRFDEQAAVRRGNE
ncbi:discoidin domain-containing protein [Myceligenerans salitolerans]|uniref:Discoidin domain-containing protein n=1 Tax=Myceligenerans salitolerans TaxID=1230528 RepID=A0ABS3IDW0_9MICO|nr:discoidin domain-containing protein [Myceligenerans salitolerans]MBO0610801.1 discoidin domain-containing protein [Myceligenerans salitolerans]